MKTVYIVLDNDNNVISVSDYDFGGGELAVEITDGAYDKLKGVNRVVEYVNNKLVIRDYTEAEITAQRAKRERQTICRQIISLKTKLKETDYQAIKYAEGQLSEEKYAVMKAQRQAWRDEINTLEAQLENL